jgi:putative thioredoxin
MALDVTDATFETEVIERSMSVPVVIDLWAPWCGPCRTLGPILEKVVDETAGEVVMVKVNVDENPQISAAFQVQSIPLVVAIKDGQPVNGFLGAQPEAAVRQFVETLLPTEEESELAALIAAGDANSLLQALQLDPGNEPAILKLAELMVADKMYDEALELLARIPESPETRRIAAMARVGDEPQDEYDSELDTLLASVKTDEAARQRYVDILELMGPDDPRTAGYRKRLTATLF